MDRCACTRRGTGSRSEERVGSRICFWLLARVSLDARTRRCTHARERKHTKYAITCKIYAPPHPSLFCILTKAVEFYPKMLVSTRVCKVCDVIRVAYPHAVRRGRMAAPWHRCPLLCPAVSVSSDLHSAAVPGLSTRDTRTWHPLVQS